MLKLQDRPSDVGGTADAKLGSCRMAARATARSSSCGSPDSDLRWRRSRAKTLGKGNTVIEPFVFVIRHFVVGHVDAIERSNVQRVPPLL
jgi:hypothetical protein